MRNLLFIVLFVFCACQLAAGFKVDLELTRPTVYMGEYIQLALSSEKQISRIDYPVVKNASWAKNIQYSQTRSINGKVTYIRIIALSPQKSGSVTIPSFKVHSGGDSASTKEIKVRVLERKAPGEKDPEGVKLADVVKGRMTILPARSAIYAGEEITLHCDLLVDERVAGQIRVNYFPELQNVGNALFTTWQTRNGKVRFTAPQPRQVTENDRTFIRYRFTARCRVLKPGPFDPGAVIRVGVVENRSSRRDDPFGDPFGDGFFDSFFSSSRVVPHNVEFKKAPAVEISALPVAPAGVFNTGLVGKWQISGAVSGSSLRQGEAAEFSMLFSGSGSPDSFAVPKLELPGFRVYPPEVIKKSGSVSVKYAIIPLTPGEQTLKLRPAVFDPEKRQWQSRELLFKVAVVKNPAAAALPQRLQPPAPVVPAGRVVEQSSEKGSAVPLHYQKNVPGSTVKTPLINNTLLWIIIFALGFPAAAMIMEFWFRKAEKDAGSPELAKRRSSRKAMAELLKELKNSGDTPEFRARLLPMLGESMGLSAGVTAGELAEKVTDPELRRYFADLDSAAFLPGVSNDPQLSSAGKKALVKLMKKFMLLLIAAWIGSPLAAAGINDNFNKGDYKAAAASYLKLAETADGYRPDMLYNYGNCHYYLGDLPGARYSLQLASLLRPWDREIRANLESVNALMFQNEKHEGSFSAMLRSLRDQLRCDIYIMLAAFFWGVLWIVWSLRRKMERNLCLSVSGVLGLLLLLSIISAVTQANSTYSKHRIIVIAGKIEMRTLPGVRSGRIETTLAGGCDGEVLRRDPSGFSLVRINGREGWVESDKIRTVLPGGIY